jgi:hypothetical protein
MPVPDELPPQLVPPSSRDLDQSVGFLKDILKHDTTNRSRSPSSLDTPISRLKDRSFDRSSPSALQGRDATIYKHDDSEPRGYFKPSNRHIDRSAIRSRAEEDSPTADLSDMKRQLENTAQRLDRAAESDAAKTKEDEELDQEMDDLKYRVKRVQDDLDYVARGPKTSSRDEERRRLERELLSLMHERIPEVERKIKARDERKERERRQWARDRDRANDRFGRYDSKDEYSSRRDEDRDRPYSRGDRPYSRGDDRDRPYSRGDNDRDRPYSRGAYDRDERDRDRDVYRRERASSRDREYDRARSSPAAAVVAPAERFAPPPPAAPAAPVARATPPPKSMTPAERQAFARAEAQRRIQERMLKLGVTTPSSPSSASVSTGLDSSVEDRLQQEKKEAEEKVKAAEKQAEERERARRERLAGEKAAAQEEKRALTPAPTTTVKVPAVAPPAPTPIPKMAPAAPKSRAPAPPPPRKAAAPRAPAVVATPPAPAPPVVREILKEPEVDPQEEALRAREAALKKQKEEREARFQERLRQLEKEEEEARLEEERYQARLQAAKAKSAVKAASPPPPAPVAVVTTPPAPAVVVPPAEPVSAPAEKSTNPFSRLIKSGGSTPAPAPAPASVPPATTNGSTNPWARPQTAPPPSIVPPPSSKSPVPTSVKTDYQTAPSEIEDDWDVVREKEDSDDSSDDEITQSRSVRANIAQQLFGGMLPRPASAAAAVSSTPSSPAPTGAGPAPPAPPAPAAPRAAPFVVPAASGPPDTNALMNSIQGGLKLRPTKTVDKSAPPVSGRVIGDVAPPAHINATPRPASPPAPAPHFAADPVGVPTAVPPTMMVDDEGSGASARMVHRQSVGWFADRAADAGAVSPVDVQRLPSTAEEEEEDGEDMYEKAPVKSVPEILVDGPVAEPQSGLMADINRGVGECCWVFFFL